MGCLFPYEVRSLLESTTQHAQTGISSRHPQQPRGEHFLRAHTPGPKQPPGVSQHPAQLCLHSLQEEQQGEASLTGVGGELEGPAEVSVACRCPGAHVEHVRGQGVEPLDVRVPGGRLHDAIAALVLVLPTAQHSGHGAKTATPLPCQRGVTAKQFSKYILRAPAAGLAQSPQHRVLHGAPSQPKKEDEAVGMMLMYH